MSRRSDSIWCRRRDLPSAAAVPCILTVRRPSQATVPGSPLLAKNSPQDCFFNAQTLSGSSPPQNKLSKYSKKQSRISDSVGAGEGT